MANTGVEGKVALVTGASRGIGAGLARCYVDKGMKLVLCARSNPILPESQDVISRSLDVRDEAGLDALVTEVEDRFGAIDLWVNNAGVLDPVAPVRDVETEAFREHIEINLTGVFIGTRRYLRHLRKLGRGGVLINVSSGAAWNAYAGWGAYCAGKAAVERFTEVVALEEAAAGLRAYSVAPGVVDTPMQDRVRAANREEFPEVERFREMKREDSLNSTRYVAEEFLAIAFDPARAPESVAVRLDNEK
jgi:NAD(P)-dependent dehydrogenase (short-subunit alcohol dehydrogenase family)